LPDTELRGLISHSLFSVAGGKALRQNAVFYQRKECRALHKESHFSDPLTLDRRCLTKLKALRQAFLEAAGGLDNYWHDEETLLGYELVLAQRIKWKWLPVIELVNERHPLPPSFTHLWDWGCGSGIAARSILSFLCHSFDSVTLTDRSQHAVQFAMRKVREISPLPVTTEPCATKDTLFVTSHVLSELDEKGLERLFLEARQAGAVLWVESGRPFESKRLIALRQKFMDAGFVPLAPCPHHQNCGMAEPHHERDWCHFFAKPPCEVGQSAFWREMGKELGFDLRSLPVSFLYLMRRELVDPSLPGAASSRSIIIGRGRLYKGYASCLICRQDGVFEERIQRRDHKELYKKVEQPGLACFLTD
jgi:hypothetical protein